MYTYLTLSYSSKISRATARTSRDAYNLAHRIRGGSVSSIFARLSACRYTMRYISVIPVACHPSISAERTVKRGSRGANLIYLSQVPSASPPFLLPFVPRGSSTWYPWYTCISFSAPLRRFLDPLSLSPPLSLSRTRFCHSLSPSFLRLLRIGRCSTGFHVRKEGRGCAISARH